MPYKHPDLCCAPRLKNTQPSGRLSHNWIFLAAVRAKQAHLMQPRWPAIGEISKSAGAKVRWLMLGAGGL